MSGPGERKLAEYKALLTEAYDLDKPEAPPQELAYYLRHIRACGEPVLEAMCGSGRYLVPLLEAQIDVDGVDAAPDMLAACAAKCAERNLTVRTYQQVLQELDLPRRYRLIFAGGASFGLIVEMAEVAESLRRLHAHLQPGGTLLIEIETQSSDERTTSSPSRWQEPERRWTCPDGAEIVLRATMSYDPEIGVVTGEGIYERLVSGKRVALERNAWISRLWDPDDFSAYLSDAGFVDMTVAKAFSSQAVDGSERMVSFVARRPR